MTLPRSLATPANFQWHGPRRARRQFSWRAILWLLVFPQRSQRTGLTLSGLLLIVISMAIGTAAYNSANNILFLTLSLLLGCLILSGVLSWLNFRGLSWRLEAEPPLRVAQDHGVALVLRNQKSFLPCYGVWFELEVASSGQTFELPLRGRLDPGQEIRLECMVRPNRRGVETLRLTHLGSLFPFGFLRKSLAVGLEEKVIVWPAPIEYRRFSISAWQRIPAGQPVRRAGQSGDLLSLHRYQIGDSHRQIHWKASARLRQLMVRQMAAETGEGFSLWIETDAERWPREEQFELLCSFAATLAEDLFKAGKLRAAGLAPGALLPVRRLRDLENFLDRLAVAAVENPAMAAVSAVSLPSNRLAAVEQPVFLSRLNLLTFAPEGARGVAAYVNGEKTAGA
jgi:uncharacterized protein (DUF58 family)